MDELRVLQKITRVKAPPGFEEQLSVLLSKKKKKKRQRVRYLRFSFAGVSAAALILFVMLNIFVINKQGPSDYADLKSAVSPRIQAEKELPAKTSIPIIETINYSREMKRLSNEPKVIYILESVSSGYREKIKY